MSNFERTTSWQQIQQGVKEIERLRGRNDYNLMMVKARLVLECMVRCMAERACLVEGDLGDTIDQLFEGGLISKAAKGNYHTIRILGNKAVHEGDNTPYDADKAYKLLTQEVYSFASELQGRNHGGGRGDRSPGSARSYQGERTGGGGRASSGSRQGGGRSSGGRQGGGSASPGGRSASGQRSSGSRTASGSRPAGRGSSQGASRQGSGRRKKRRRVSPLFYLWRFLIPILVIVLLVVIVKVFIPGKDKAPDATSTAPTAPTVTTVAPEPEPAPPEPPTEPEPEPVASIYKIKGSGVNVRSEPNTDSSSTVLVQLPDGTEVEYVDRHNKDWARINYDGREAYVSYQFLERVEPETQAQGSQGNESTAQE